MNSPSLPTTFHELIINSSHFKVEINDSVLEPLALIDLNEEGEYTVNLAGRKFIRGEEKVGYTASLQHDYVIIGDTAHPLPRGIVQIVQEFFFSDGANSLSISKIIRITRTKSPPIDIRFSKEIFKRGKDHAKQEGSNYHAPESLHATLYQYQKEGIFWITNNLRKNGGVIIADEMGLGKTIQVIASILEISPTEQNPVLIICPTSLLTNWNLEIEKFAPSLSTHVHRGPDRAGIVKELLKTKIVLSTYDTIVNDALLIGAINWKCIVWDEAQALKNPESARREAMSKLSSQYAVLMTGTPVETSLLDLWSLVDLAMPNVLGSKSDFLDEFPDIEESAIQLNELTSPLILRRTVADVAQDLPERIDIELPISLDEHLQKKYEQIRLEALDEYGVAGGLVATTRLSVFCAHPWLASNSIDRDNIEDIPLQKSNTYDLISPKVEITRSIISEATSENKKILVFSNYNNINEILHTSCMTPDISYWNAINGSTPQEDRQTIIDQFSNTEGGAVLVLNPKAAGAGLNITAATIVIHYTPVWNPALEAQASARAHRRGQKHPVKIYKLFYVSTVEQVMIERSQFRKELGNLAIPEKLNDNADLKRILKITPC